MRRFADLFLFFSGLALVFNETVISGPLYNTPVVILGAFMMGLPAMMRPESPQIEDKPAKPKPLPRDTDLRIVAKLPPTALDKQIAKEMRRLEKYDEAAKLPV